MGCGKSDGSSGGGKGGCEICVLTLHGHVFKIGSGPSGLNYLKKAYSGTLFSLIQNAITQFSHPPSFFVNDESVSENVFIKVVQSRRSSTHFEKCDNAMRQHSFRIHHLFFLSEESKKVVQLTRPCTLFFKTWPCIVQAQFSHPASVFYG